MVSFRRQVLQYDIASVLGSVFGVEREICDSITITNIILDSKDLLNSIRSFLEFHLSDQLVEIDRHSRFKSELLSGKRMFE